MTESQNPRSVLHREWGTVRLYRASRRFWLHKWRIPALIAKYLNVVVFRCYIDPQAEIGPRLDLPHGGFGVVIGPRATIGSDAVIFHNVTIGSRRPGPTTIGDRAYIGTGAKILGPLNIGSDVLIGANAIVVEDIPDGATVVGAASRIITKTKLKESACASQGTAD